MRADLDAALAHLAEKLARVRDDAVAAADARVAGAEARLLSRLDEIAAGVTQAVQRSTIDNDVLARLDVVERETSESRLALEERFGAQLKPLEADVARMLEVQRTELEHAFDSRIGEIRAELVTLSASGQQLDEAQRNLGRKLKRLAEKISRPADAGLEAADAIERRVTEAVDKLADRLGARQAELEARVEQLQAGLDGEAAKVEAAVGREEQWPRR